VWRGKPLPRCHPIRVILADLRREAVLQNPESRNVGRMRSCGLCVTGMLACIRFFASNSSDNPFLAEWLKGLAGPTLAVERERLTRSLTASPQCPRECEWTWMCVPPSRGRHEHANAAGYGFMASAFQKTLAGR
jgi:hypothetical protein